MLGQKTKWHWTADANTTLCGRVIPLMGEGWMLPDTRDEPETVTCKKCRAGLRQS